MNALVVCPLCHSGQTQTMLRHRERRFRMCAACGLTFAEPDGRPTRSMEAAHYAKHENDPADPAYRRFLARAIEPLLAVVPRGASGLDYGCGPGPTASLMLRAAGVHCVDYDPFFFPNPGALCGRERYDCIVCTETCEHFHQPLRDFALLDRLLKPGGWLALMTEPRDPEASFASWWYPGDPTHVSFFAPSTIDWLAARFAWESQRPSRTVWLLRKGRQG